MLVPDGTTAGARTIDCAGHSSLSGVIGSIRIARRAGGRCLALTLRDYGRIGQFILDGAPLFVR